MDLDLLCRKAKKITITDVAQHANVSGYYCVTCIKSKGRISAQTIARVQKAIDELGFVRNQTAANLHYSIDQNDRFDGQQQNDFSTYRMVAGISDVLGAKWIHALSDTMRTKRRGLIKSFSPYINKGSKGSSCLLSMISICYHFETRKLSNTVSFVYLQQNSIAILITSPRQYTQRKIGDRAPDSSGT